MAPHDLVDLRGRVLSIQVRFFPQRGDGISETLCARIELGMARGSGYRGSVNGLNWDRLFNLHDFLDDWRLSCLDGSLDRLRTWDRSIRHEVELLFSVLLHDSCPLILRRRRIHDRNCSRSLGYNGRYEILNKKLILLESLWFECIPFRCVLDKLEELLSAPKFGEGKSKLAAGGVVKLDVLDPRGT